MKHIIKSYLKSYFKNWIEAWGLIVFIIIIIASLVSILSGTVQFSVRYNEINDNSKQWQFKLASSFGFEEFKGDFLRDYYFGNDVEKYQLKKPVEEGTKILNQTAFDLCKDSLDETKVKGNCILKNLSKFYFDSDNSLLTEEGKDYLKKYDNNFAYALYSEFFNQTSSKDEKINYKVLYEPNVIINNVDNTSTENKNENKKQLYVQSILSKTENPNDINKVTLVGNKSVMPKTNDLTDSSHKIEILVGQLYAEKNNIKIGDQFTFPNLPFVCKVTGYGISLRTVIEQGNNQSSGILNFSSEYGQIYMNKADVSRLIHQSQKPSIISSSFYLTSPNGNDVIKLKDIYKRFEKVFEQPEEQIFDFNSSNVAKQIQSIRLQIILFLSIGFILLGLGFIFINFIMKKEVDKTRKQIGIFKGFGYKTSELTWVFATKFFLTMIIGVVIGYLASLPLQLYINKNYVNNITIPFSLIYTDWWFLTLFFVVIPFVFTALAYLIIFFYVKKPILQLINANLKARNGFLKSAIKKMFSKTTFIFKMQLAFTLKSFLKWFIVCVIFMITSALFLMSFDINPIFSSLIDNMYVTSKNDVDHIVNFNYLTSAVGKKDDTNPTLNLMEKYPITFTKINDEKTNEANLKVQAENFHEYLQEFLKLENPNLEPDKLLELSTKIYDVQLTHRSIYLEDFIKAFTYLEKVFEINGIDKSEIQFNADDFINKMNIINKDNQVDKPMIVINQYNYNPKKELPYLSLKIYRIQDNSNATLENFSLTALQESSNWNEFFTFKNINTEKWNQVFNWKESDAIPLIVSKRTSLKLGLKVNDSFNFSIRSKEKIILKAKIVDIIENETLAYNVYTDYKQIVKYYKYKNNPVGDNFYTAVASKNKIIKNEVYFLELMKGNLVKIDMENQVFTLSISSEALAIPSTIKTFLDDIKNINALNVLNHPANIKYKKLMLKFAKEGIKISSNSILVIQILISIIILIILVVISSSIIDENSNIILTFKALGYKTSQINLIVVGSYVFGIILAFILGCFISILAWSYILDYVYTSSDILILIPWGWQTPLKSGSIIATILFFAWSLTIYLVQKKNAVVLTDQ